MSTVHDFRRSLTFSHNCSDLSCWAEIYEKAFPTVRAIIDHREDGQHQRAGIDRSVVLAGGKQLYIDEKVREKDWGDIALEYVSNNRTGALGWVEKHLLADYIAYAFLPSGRAYLFPVPQLQAAWAANRSMWLSKFGTIKAANAGYETLCCCVETNELFKAIGKCLRVSFTPIEDPA